MQLLGAIIENIFFFRLNKYLQKIICVSSVVFVGRKIEFYKIWKRKSLTRFMVFKLKQIKPKSDQNFENLWVSTRVDAFFTETYAKRFWLGEAVGESVVLNWSVPTYKYRSIGMHASENTDVHSLPCAKLHILAKW